LQKFDEKFGGLKEKKRKRGREERGGKGKSAMRRRRRLDEKKKGMKKGFSGISRLVKKWRKEKEIGRRGREKNPQSKAYFNHPFLNTLRGGEGN